MFIEIPLFEYIFTWLYFPRSEIETGRILPILVPKVHLTCTYIITSTYVLRRLHFTFPQLTTIRHYTSSCLCTSTVLHFNRHDQLTHWILLFPFVRHTWLQCRFKSGIPTAQYCLSSTSAESVTLHDDSRNAICNRHSTHSMWYQATVELVHASIGQSRYGNFEVCQSRPPNSIRGTLLGITNLIAHSCSGRIHLPPPYTMETTW